MARVIHPVQLITGKPGYPVDGLDLTFLAATPADDERFQNTGREILIAFNSDDDTAYTVTINSVADPKTARTLDITADSIPFQQFHYYGPFDTPGWNQSDGYLHFEANNAAVKFAVLRVR